MLSPEGGSEDLAVSLAGALGPKAASGLGTPATGALDNQPLHGVDDPPSPSGHAERSTLQGPLPTRSLGNFPKSWLL